MGLDDPEGHDGSAGSSFVDGPGGCDLGADSRGQGTVLVPRAAVRFPEVDGEEPASLSAVEAGVDRTEAPDDEVTRLALECP